MPVIRVTDQTSKAKLEAAIAAINAEAKALSRRGYIGTHGADYPHHHERIDALLVEWESASS